MSICVHASHDMDLLILPKKGGGDYFLIFYVYTIS